MVEFAQNSRYRQTPIVKFDGFDTLGPWTEPEFLESNPLTTLIADGTNAGRADLISQQFYGTPDFFWAIIAYNRSTDINFPKTGDEVRIPSPLLVLGS